MAGQKVCLLCGAAVKGHDTNATLELNNHHRQMALYFIAAYAKNVRQSFYAICPSVLNVESESVYYT